jgi:cysteine synthase
MAGFYSLTFEVVPKPCTIGIEIREQTGGKAPRFISGLGTSGAFMGISRRLKGYSEDVHVYAIQPDSPFHSTPYRRRGRFFALVWGKKVKKTSCRQGQSLPAGLQNALCSAIFRRYLSGN